MRLISHSGRTRSFYLSKLIASVTGRGDRLGEREPCTSYRLFGELCAGSSRRVTGLSCITCAAPARNGSSGTDRCTERERSPCPGVGLLPAEDPVLALSSRHLDSCARVTRPPALLAERPAPLSPKLIPEEWHPPGFDIV